MDSNSSSKKSLLQGNLLQYYLNTANKQSNDRRIYHFLNSLSVFNTYVKKKFTGFSIVVADNYCKIKKNYSQEFRELSTLHTRREIPKNVRVLRSSSFGSSKKIARSKETPLFTVQHALYKCFEK